MFKSSALVPALRIALPWESHERVRLGAAAAIWLLVFKKSLYSSSVRLIFLIELPDIFTPLDNSVYLEVSSPRDAFWSS